MAKIQQKLAFVGLKTMRKHSLNNSKTTLKKSTKRFFDHQNVQNLKNRQNGSNFWKKISIFNVIYRPLELEIHPEVGFLKPKTMTKHFFLNNFKTILKNQRKPFWQPKWLNWPVIITKMGQTVDPRFRFSMSFITLWC